MVRGPRGLCSRGPLGNPQGKGEDRAGRKEKRPGGEQRGRKERERLAGRDDEGAEERGAPVPSISRSVTDDE